MKKILLLAIACVALSAAHAQKADTTIVFAKLVHEFGNIPQNAGPQTYSFEFTNKGKEPLLIQNVAASCGCTTPGWTKEPIAPGATGFVKATYNPSSISSFDKSLTVTSSGTPSPIVLRIRGTVIEPTN